MIRFLGVQMSPAFDREAAELLRRKQVQVDTDVAKRMEPYTPKKTGKKIDIGATGSPRGSGTVSYKSGIARENYYENRGTGVGGMNAKKSRGLRGKQWFARMKADHKVDILKGAQNAK